MIDLNFGFFVKSTALGVSLAMDAFSVSLANGLNEPKMKARKAVIIAFVFALFQAAMPLIGWVCVHTIAEQFAFFEKLIPYIALVLLGFIGGKMLIDGIKNKCEGECCATTFKGILVQGVATSIDALSTGFTISEYNALSAIVCALIIAVVTFIICFAGVFIGKKFGTSISGKAGIFGGIILIIIGVQIFIKGVF